MKKAHSIKKWHLTRAAVPLEIPILEKADGKRRSFLEWKNWCLLVIRRKQKLTRTVTFICWRFPYCLNVVDFIRAMTLSSCKTVLHHTAPKATQQSLRQTTPDYIAADELASYSPDVNPVDYCIWDILQDLVFEGWQLQFANLQDLKKAIKNKWKEVTIDTVRKSIAQW